MTGAPGTHRIVEKVTDMKLEPFNRYGDEVTKLFWNPITFDRKTGNGCFIIRFMPGGVSQPHEHLGFEEFYVVEGQMVDHDGVAYEAGSFVSLGPNVRHYSHAPEGVLLVAWLSGNNRALEVGEEMSFGPDTIKTGHFLPATGKAPKGPIGTHRVVEKVTDLELTPFDRYGEDVSKLHWNPITFDRETGKGCFIIRFQPGGVSTPHEHFGMEEFYVVEGMVMDHDGQKYEAGDFVSLGPGVRHYSYSPDGALMVAWLTDTNRTLAEGEELSFGPDVVQRARYKAQAAAE